MLVDDEQGILRALRRVLAHGISAELDAYDIKLEIFDSPALALERAQEVSFAVVVSDYRMPDMNGVKLLTAMREFQPLAMRMVLSGYADMPALVAAINEARIHCFLGKPWDDAELRSAVVQALALHERLRDSEDLADVARLQLGDLTAHELEVKRLENTNPALVRVNWAPNGGVLLEHEDDE